MPQIPLSKEAMSEEIVSAIRILTKWRDRLDKGIPGIDVAPGDNAALVNFFSELCGELVLVGNKCHSIAEIVNTGSSE